MESGTLGQQKQAPIGWPIWAAAAIATLACAWGFVFWLPELCPVRWSPYILAKLLLISPLLEEAAFRGGVQTLLLAKLPRSVNLFGVSAANVITTLLFGATYVFFGSWIYATVVVPSLVLGALYERCGKLWPVILLHVAYNAALLAACIWI